MDEPIIISCRLDCNYIIVCFDDGTDCVLAEYSDRPMPDICISDFIGMTAQEAFGEICGRLNS